VTAPPITPLLPPSTWNRKSLLQPILRDGASRLLRMRSKLLKHNNLMPARAQLRSSLRSERRERLEAWQQAPIRR
jgi:hypothetical protein